MSTKISLDQLPDAQRIQHFQEMSSSLFVPASLKCDDPVTFRFARSEKTFGSLSFGLGQVNKLDVKRTPRDVMRSESDMTIKATLVLSSAAPFRQDNREALTTPGQMYVNDPARPNEEQIFE